LLLGSLGHDQRAVVTLIAYTADAALSPRICAMPRTVRSVAWRRTAARASLISTPKSWTWSEEPNTTYDGVHFTYETCRTWNNKIQDVLLLHNSSNSKEEGGR
jgi:hypothetical protein